MRYVLGTQAKRYSAGLSSTWTEPSWRFGNVQSCAGGPLVVGDELYFYFNGRPKPAPDAPGWDADFQAGLAILRRDGFASMDAGPGTKTLTTRPVSFQGRYLFVNVDCPSGELKVEVLNEAGAVISPFTLANCDPITSDTTLEQVTWGENDDLTALAGEPIRFRFTMDTGSLYAFWVSPDKSGASGGYVGAGGPGFTGPVDTVGESAALVDFVEYSRFALGWGDIDCGEPSWCGGTDMNRSGSVDVNDLIILTDRWLINCYAEPLNPACILE
ncbi:MAG: hypothetical protein ACYSYW_13305 [Planctomycetota bacterium]